MIRFFSSRVSSRTVGQAPLRLRRLLPTFMLVLVMGGLVFQALQGDRGLRSWQELRAKSKERAIVLAEPPSLTDAEITAKGNLNFRKVLTRRADLLERLYDEAASGIAKL